MNAIRRTVRASIVAACAASFLLGTGSALASDESDVKALVDRWVADFNKGNFKAFVAACAARTAVVDGFPPYAWQTCADWMRGYEANNHALKASHGTLSIGVPAYTEFNGKHAYLIYPATFADTQEGKPVTYKGTWTMTLQKTAQGWAFTGSASAWGVNDL